MDANRSGGASGNEPCTVVLFGASGDLAKRKVIPSDVRSGGHGLLGPNYAIVGFARTPMNDESFRASLRILPRTCRKSADRSQKVDGVCFQPSTISTGNTAKPTISRICERLTEIEGEKKLAGNRLFICPPSRSVQGYRRATWQGRAGEAHVANSWCASSLKSHRPGPGFCERVEQDRVSVRRAYRSTDRPLSRQGYGANLLVLRFSNGIFEPCGIALCRSCSNHAAETSCGKARRLLRDRRCPADMIQSHVLQLTRWFGGNSGVVDATR